MAKPKIVDKSPVRCELEAGKNYAWCACGESSNQPWCDGSHKGSSFNPIVFTAEENKTRSMCLCKASGNQGFCDGTHMSL